MRASLPKVADLLRNAAKPASSIPSHRAPGRPELGRMARSGGLQPTVTGRKICRQGGSGLVARLTGASMRRPGRDAGVQQVQSSRPDGPNGLPRWVDMPLSSAQGACWQAPSFGPPACSSSSAFSLAILHAILHATTRDLREIPARAPTAGPGAFPQVPAPVPPATPARRQTGRAASHGGRPGLPRPGTCAADTCPREEAAIERYWKAGAGALLRLPARFNVAPTQTVPWCVLLRVAIPQDLDAHAGAPGLCRPGGARRTGLPSASMRAQGPGEAHNGVSLGAGSEGSCRPGLVRMERARAFAGAGRPPALPAVCLRRSHGEPLARWLCIDAGRALLDRRASRRRNMRPNILSFAPGLEAGPDEYLFPSTTECLSCWMPASCRLDGPSRLPPDVLRHCVRRRRAL